MLTGYPNEAAVHVALSTIRKCLGKLKEQKKVQHSILAVLTDHFNVNIL